MKPIRIGVVSLGGTISQVPADPGTWKYDPDNNPVARFISEHPAHREDFQLVRDRVIASVDSDQNTEEHIDALTEAIQEFGDHCDVIFVPVGSNRGEELSNMLAIALPNPPVFVIFISSEQPISDPENYERYGLISMVYLISVGLKGTEDLTPAISYLPCCLDFNEA